jgi:hypothetical protein
MTAPVSSASSALHAAFHEGAHFVAHHHLLPAEDPYELAISGDGTGHFALGAARGLENTRERVVALYAGAAADLQLDPSRAEAVRVGAARDDREAAEWLRRLGESDREAEYRVRAETLVAGHWREIEVIAAMLLEVGTLRGDVATMVLDLLNGWDLDSAARRLDLAPDTATAMMLAFAFRLAPGHVAGVLARYGYEAPRGRG